uniref:Calmodulin-binding protein-like n=1 Tax=Leersia perrieri TaxID=77586 RepID=A0A0D9XV86_9ORYZ
MATHAAASGDFSGDPPLAGADSECSTPFVSAPSSPSRDHHFSPHGACFFSAPASPTRGGGKDFSGGCLADFDFDFSSRFPSPSAAAMSSADELFHNGQIRPVRLSAMLLQPQPLAPLAAGKNHILPATTAEDTAAAAAAEEERGRIRSRSVRRKARSMSPFRTPHWRRASSPAPAPESVSVELAATPAASRSSSSSSTASSTSSSSSSRGGGSRRWAFLKDLLHRSKSDGGGNKNDALPPATKRSASPSPSPSMGTANAAAGRRGGNRRRSAHERMYEARRAEAEEMRRRTYLPYRQQGLLLFGCIGIGSRGYGAAVHGLARAAAVSSRS